jgi:hypothetical protein
VSTSVGSDCGTTPMRVCTGTDPEGNVCNSGRQAAIRVAWRGR